LSAPGKSCELLVVGEYFCDLIFAGLQDVPRPGAEFYATGLTVRPGGCYNMAVALARLGIATEWACDFGTDLFSRAVLAQAARDGIGSAGFTVLDHDLQRVSAAFTYGTERGFISFSEAPVTPPDPALLDRLKPDWLLQSFRFEPDWLAFLRHARAGGARIFGDCRHGEFSLATPGVRDFLACCDVFSPNEAEALAVTGAPNLETAIDRLADLTPVVVVKRGASGARANNRGERLDAAAPPVAVVDTIGAGDAFNAGYLAGVLWGRGVADCLALAVACGALSTTGPGSSAVPDAATLTAFADTSGRRRPATEAALAGP